MQQIKGDDVINGIIDEVLNPQLSQIIIEAWRDLAQTDRNRERQEVTTPFSVLVRHKYLPFATDRHVDLVSKEPMTPRRRASGKQKYATLCELVGMELPSQEDNNAGVLSVIPSSKKRTGVK